MFFDINKNLCECFTGLDPIKLLDYPAEDVFNLISGTIDWNNRNNKKSKQTKSANKIRRPASDNWF